MISRYRVMYVGVSDGGDNRYEQKISDGSLMIEGRPNRKIHPLIKARQFVSSRDVIRRNEFRSACEEIDDNHTILVTFRRWQWATEIGVYKGKSGNR
ncbi:hypothetical protein CEXT_587381 [Caerostris extrusa]|uniref:Uncharacterized protein n=1 Tax=Caerostris extrusa TaxID=172846 RepID=A0AAV4UCG7_CAEEX|nr:hypothetical protein CEXT_587381 [Caerostris extrusa]